MLSCRIRGLLRYARKDGYLVVNVFFRVYTDTVLKKKQRLSRSEFANLLKKGRRVHDTHFSLIYLPSAETKCGLVVSKKVAKQAVARNLIRRRVYAIFVENLALLTNKHVALLTKPTIKTLSYQELNNTLENAIRSITSLR